MNTEKRKNEALINRIKSVMYEKELSKNELADKIGSSPASVWRILSGRYPIDSLDMISKLSTALDIPLAEILQLSFNEILDEKITISINCEGESKKEKAINEFSNLIRTSNLSNIEIRVILDWVSAYIKYREQL